MITIKEESRRLSKLVTNYDNFASRYRTENGYYTFPSPSLDTIDKNLFYLLKNSTEKEFESKYKMRPDYLSYDEYNTTTLWYLLLYVNSVFSIEDFDLDKVVIPSIDSIIYITQDKVQVDKNNLTTIEW